MQGQFIDKVKVNKVMIIAVLVFYLGFIVYLLVSREPDYFSSKKARGVVSYITAQEHISNNGLYIKNMPVVDFNAEGVEAEVSFYVDDYLQTFAKGDSVTIAYTGDQSGGKAAIV